MARSFILVLLMIAVTASVIFAGGIQEPPVGIVLPTKDAPRWLNEKRLFMDALKAEGYDARVLFSQTNATKQKSNVEALVTEGAKVLILCPQDPSGGAAEADMAHAGGAKVISFDRLIGGSASVDYYATFDSAAIGAACGKYLASKASGTGNDLYLYTGSGSDSDTFVFFQSVWSVLQPKISDGTFVVRNSSEAAGLQDRPVLTKEEAERIIDQVSTDSDPDKAKSLAEVNLTAAPASEKSIAFVCAPDDASARAIADAFAADKDVSKYYITGQGAEIDSLRYIADGRAIDDGSQGRSLARTRRGQGRCGLSQRCRSRPDDELFQWKDQRCLETLTDSSGCERKHESGHYRFRVPAA